MEFYISTLLGSKQVVHHHFICITTSFRSQLYLGHNNFYIATLFESEQVLDHNFIWIIPSFTSSLYLDHTQVLHHNFTWIKTSSTSPCLLHLLTPMVIWCSILLYVAKLQMHRSLSSMAVNMLSSSHVT